MRRTVGVAGVCLFVPFLLLAQSSDRQKIVDSLSRDLKSRDAATRVDAAERIGELGYAEGVEPLVLALEDREARVRAAAAGGLWDSSSRAVSTAAAVDPAARDKALETLREYHYEFTEEAYFSALNDVELEIVTAFLDAGMSPNQRFANSYGNPALRVVLEASEGCDPTVRPTAENTKAIVKLLLARGGDPNIADDRGNTPLMTAAGKCDPAIVKILLAAKANMNAKNISDMTAFEFGLWNATDGAAAIAAAGFRLSPEKVKMYREAYAKEPAKLELLKKATKSTPAKK